MVVFMKSKELKEVGYLYLIQIVNFVLPIFLIDLFGENFRFGWLW